MVDYTRLNYTDFIEQAKKLNTDEEKISFVTDYIKHYCEYDYAFLLFAIMKGSGFYNVQANYRRIDTKDTYLEDFSDYSQITHALSLTSLVATSNLFKEILSCIDTNDFSRVGYNISINKIKIKLYNYLCNYLDDPNLIEYYVDEAIKVLESELKKTYYNDRMTKYVKTMDYVIFDMCNDLHYLFDRKYDKGMITKGVCEGFSDFVVRACEDLDIPCVKVCSENHAWNLAKINGEFIMIDTTSSLVGFDIDRRFYFDKVLTKEDIEEDMSLDVNWNHMTLDEFFSACPNRKIIQIGEWMLDGSINEENYKEKDVSSLLTDSFDDDVSDRKQEMVFALKNKK